jgi:hypothetical protein
MRTVQLEELIGEHYLSGVEFDLDNPTSNGVYFSLDNVVYFAEEDDPDGLRSSLGNITITSRKKLKNSFEEQKVIIEVKDEMLIMYDDVTGKLVFELGTDNTDEYYPLCIMRFTPENMAINS